MPKAKRKSKRNNRRKWTPIDSHTQQRGDLIPPFITHLGSKLQITSWMNDRLPEMLWAGLIATAFDRETALGVFRTILNYTRDHQDNETLHDLTISGIAKLDPPLRSDLVQFITGLPGVAPALSPLLLFNDLPAKNDWQGRLPDTQPDVAFLMVAVAEMLHHQSETSTDCRWLRVMGMVAAGKMTFSPELRHVFDEWLKYPADYDKVQGSVRSSEGALFHPPTKPADLTWPKTFWSECWSQTPCILIPDEEISLPVEAQVTRQQISYVLENLQYHWQRTHSTTHIDPKHDGVFGMAFYCLRTLNEIMGIGNSTGILGRLGLRTILETRVNLAYLLKQDDQALWENWRRHGAGQAKLNVLKFQDNEELPGYIDLETLEAIASEDLWAELLTINLGSWNKSDLRTTSETAGIKHIYDQHYPWTSSYAHATWGAIRESGYQTCANPLHRLHRYPNMQPLDDCLHDAAKLVDQILEQLDHEYPTFKHRVLEKVSEEPLVVTSPTAQEQRTTTLAASQNTTDGSGQP